MNDLIAVVSHLEAILSGKDSTEAVSHMRLQGSFEMTHERLECDS